MDDSKSSRHPSPTHPVGSIQAGPEDVRDAAQTLAPSELAPHTPTLTDAQLDSLRRNQFQKGRSGNPGGRPKAEVTLREVCRGYTKEAVEKLVTLMKTAKDQKVQLRAAEVLLDRGYGKVAQAQLQPEDTRHEGDAMTLEDLDKALDA